MTAERAAAPIEADEPPAAGDPDGLIAVPLTLPFIGHTNPIGMSTLPPEIAELLGEAVRPGS